MQKIKNYYHLLQAYVANLKTGFPAKDLKIIGVTGTDGKTTCTSMIYHVLKENGFKVAMISTLYAKVGDKQIDTGLHVTTPEPWQLPGILRQMKEEGIEYVVLETTSQGLIQNRVFGVEFDACLITNIGHDHLDYHKSWENYAKAKFKLVEKTRKEGIAVVNKDHESYEWISQKFKRNFKIKNLPELVTYSKGEVENLESSIEGLKFEYNLQNFHIPLIGEYNLENSLAVIKLCKRYMSLSLISNALKSFAAPIGRMQIMKTDPTIIVDFAHTPSSLERALTAIKEIKKNNSKVICLFGCAGERDKKRRDMGGISVQLADITLVSLEDPRTEKVKKINDEIILSAEEKGGFVLHRFSDHQNFEDKKTEIINEVKKLNNKEILIAFDYDEVQNRIDAIEFGLALLEPVDILFVTGKGHEESLAIGSPVKEYPYTDQETILARI